MKKKHMLWLVGSAVGILFAWHFVWSAGTPNGQPPLTYLSPNNPEQFKADFDGGPENARLVLLLSPT